MPFRRKRMASYPRRGRAGRVRRRTSRRVRRQRVPGSPLKVGYRL